MTRSRALLNLCICITVSMTFALSANTDNTRFYQCDGGAKGVIISQFPCSKDAEVKTVSTFVPRDIRSTTQDVVQLNKIQFEQQVDILESQLRGSKQKIRQFQRNRMTERRDSLEKLERLMDKEAKKALEKTVKAEVAVIEDKYDRLVQEQRQLLTNLTNELSDLKKRYNQ